MFITKFLKPDVGLGGNGGTVAEPTPTSIESQVNAPITEPVQPTNTVEPVNPQQEPTKPVQTPEENAKYASIRREYETKIATETQKARQAARDEFIASQGYSWNGKPITTEEEYNQALLEKQYQDKGLDANLINDAINNNPIVKQAQDLIAKQQQQEAKNAEYMDFLATYPDVKPETISAEVWELNNKGVPLKYAYAATQETANLKVQLAEFQKGQQTTQINTKNALNSMGSLNGQGQIPTDFITKEVFEANKSDRKWMYDNYDMIKKSMNLWK